MTDHITEPARRVPVLTSADVVVVVGSGPSGLAAALAAARAGASVGLLVVGRSVGGDRVSHAAARNMMCCAVGGQGAGVAAAVAVRSGRTVRDVDIADVQTELIRQGARLH